ncbi:MAG: hypothetical protein K0R67_1738, partial [Paenibacillus sp.]|nr:hypothetical protein [Paenibacillus sp.]
MMIRSKLILLLFICFFVNLVIPQVNYASSQSPIVSMLYKSPQIGSFSIIASGTTKEDLVENLTVTQLTYTVNLPYVITQTSIDSYTLLI